MLETQRSNATVVYYLRNSLCGYDGKDPKVCCQLDASDNVQKSPEKKPPMNKINKIQNIGSTGYETITSPKLPSQKTCGRPNSTHIRVVGGQEAELGMWV